MHKDIQVNLMNDKLSQEDCGSLFDVEMLNAIVRLKITAAEKRWFKFKFFTREKKLVRKAIKICRNSKFFDSDWYLTQYPEVKQYAAEPVVHYVKEGARDCKDPGPRFSTSTYFLLYPELIKSKVNPLMHFEKTTNASNLNAKKNVIGIYEEWIKAYDTLTDADRDAIRIKIKNLKYRPVISIVMPVYNTPKKWLNYSIKSVLKQLYPHWELCIADDASTQPHVKRILQRYARKDSRIKVVYREKNAHISVASNTALQLATGDFVSLLDHDDELAEHALFKVVEEINNYPDVGLIYSDEDKIDTKGQRVAPYFKSDWNPDLLYSQNYISHLGTYRRSILVELNGFREGYEGSQDYDLALRTIEKLSPAQIRHIPHILYHWRMIPGSVALGPDQKTYSGEAAQKAIQSHLERMGMNNAKVVPNPELNIYHRVIFPLPTQLPLVSVIIPTKDKVELLKQCITSILDKTSYTNFELIIVDNQSCNKETYDYYEQIKENQRIKMITYEMPFNYSKINNFAVASASGEFIVFLNNDTEIISPNWMSEMLSHATRPEIGAVGAKLYYPNKSIQHVGVICGIGGVAGHLYSRAHGKTIGHSGKAILTQNFLAVTAACMMMRRSLFQELDGFNEENLPIAFNDVDLCLRIYQKGYRILWTPYAELYHHESATRGLDLSPEQIERAKNEIDYMKMTWSEFIEKDPFYNINLSLHASDYSLAFPPRLNPNLLAIQ